MKPPKIIGISLVQNENIHIKWAISNIIDFCDKIIVLDNYSSDGTYDIVENMAKKCDKIKLFKISNPLVESHPPIEKYAGERAWVFGVDGDEIYDPNGLTKIKEEIYDGKYDNYWQLRSYFLNATIVDKDKKEAKGYLAPPSREATKLHNFHLLKYWKSDTERLHGRNKAFKDGIDPIKFNLYDECDWEDANLRCIHACFAKRSTNQKEGKIRFAPREVMKRRCRDMKDIKAPDIPSKIDKYGGEELITKDISDFIIKEK